MLAGNVLISNSQQILFETIVTIKNKIFKLNFYLEFYSESVFKRDSYLNFKN